uniref:Transposable element P transposase n=1 Tax=Photinus pyralis TaxID=7054 RepID=A0A1Y1L874_PHOPY
MYKITQEHLNPNSFQKMRVKFAVQIFPHTVAAAIKSAQEIGQLRSTTSFATATFIENINNIFDALNSRVLRDANPYKRPLSIYNSKTEDVLEAGLVLFENIEVYENNRQRKNIYCLKGFQCTIKAILLLWNKLKKEQVKYLLTNFTNQDPLENVFSVVRNCSGYNPNPTIRQFRISMERIISIRLKSNLGNSNCEIDDSEHLDLDVDIPMANNESNSEMSGNISFLRQVSELNKSSNIENSEKVIQNKENIGPIPEKPTLELSSNIYVAGYLAHTLLKHHDCEICKPIILKSDNASINKSEYFCFKRTTVVTNLFIS